MGETVPTPEQSAISIRVLATNFVRVNTPNQPIRKNDQVWKKPSRGVPVVAECSLLAMEFARISYEFCSREANMLADGLAKHCFSNSTSEFWETFVPDFILHNYVNDLAII